MPVGVFPIEDHVMIFTDVGYCHVWKIGVTERTSSRVLSVPLKVPIAKPVKFIPVQLSSLTSGYKADDDNGLVEITDSDKIPNSFQFAKFVKKFEIPSLCVALFGFFPEEKPVCLVLVQSAPQ